MKHLKLIKETNKLKETFKEQISGYFSEGDSVAVKLHMGEKYNKNYLKPKLVKQIVDVLLEEGVKPFLFDSVVLYAGARDTVDGYLKVAEEHGFTEEAIGCPVMIGEKGTNAKAKDINVHVCKELASADGMVVLSHVKGHCQAGFGAAIKNLGMGGITSQSKAKIHQAEEASFDELLAQGAGAVLKKASKVFYVNFLIDIVKNCDCANDGGPVIADDMGVLFGKDIAAIDKASLDLVEKQKPGVFRKAHPNCDAHLHVKYAAKLGIGELKYDIS